MEKNRASCVSDTERYHLEMESRTSELNAIEAQLAEQQNRVGTGMITNYNLLMYKNQL